MARPSTSSTPPGVPCGGSGPDLFHLGQPAAATYDNKVNGGRWIECTWKTEDGALYGWYHNEPSGLCPRTTLTAPRIGAVRSTDNGASFQDLGLVLESRPGTLRCDAKNGYFAGGNGDFTIMLDPKQEFLYFFFGSYAGEVSQQGVCVARMALCRSGLSGREGLEMARGRLDGTGDRRPPHADISRRD